MWKWDNEKVNFVRADQSSLINSMLTKKIEIIAGLIHSRSADYKIDFSQTYRKLEDGKPIGLGLSPSDSDLRNLVDYTLQILKIDSTYDNLYANLFGKDTTYYYPIEVFEGVPWPYTFENSPRTMTRYSESIVDKIDREKRFKAIVQAKFEPLSFVDTTGLVVGFDVDILREFSERWRRSRYSVDILPVSSIERDSSITDNAADIGVAAWTHTNAREENIDFSQTYFVTAQRLLVRTDSKITSLRDLQDKIIAANEKETSIYNIERNRKKMKIGNIKIDKDNRASDRAVAKLRDGKVQAFVTDDVVLSIYAKKYAELQIVGDRLSEERYGIGLRQNDHRFRDLINFTLQDMERDGTLETIFNHWFGGSGLTRHKIEIWPNDFRDTGQSIELYFETKANLDNMSYPTLNKFVLLMQRNPELFAEIYGHSDNSGNSEENLTLSIARAEMVKGYLIRSGIESYRIIKVEGLGDVEPKYSNQSESQRKNRRVEIRLVK